MITVFKKELASFLNSSVAWMVILVFLAGIGLPTWVFPETSVLDYGYADLTSLFTTGPWLLMFLSSAVTMKTFAEERKMGTLDMLLTRPVGDLGIVAGKFLAAWTLVFLALLPTVTYYFSVYELGNPPGNLDTPGFLGSWLGLMLLAGVFTSFGILGSSITNSQIVSFLVSALLCFLMWTGWESMAEILSWADATIIRQLGIFNHYESIGRGLIDSRDLVYFLSLIVINLTVSLTILASRKW
ncbi:MAG: gliding motility-associated ABC transporter permease subunit GldF [Bacteroidetes bacterium]|nr:gliding motility-associated ABC transporter permease subunit GldF [Bacteroidota bacterium]